MGNLLPNEALIYERSEYGVVYARYRDPPHNNIPRWVIGGDPAGFARAPGELISYPEWQELCALSLENTTVKTLLTTLVATYMLVRKDK